MSKTNFEFLDALGQIARDKGISVETLLDALANALVAAYKRRPDAAEEAVVTIDPDSGEIRVYGQELNEEGEVVREWDDTPDDFGRIAAQTAKQVILQRIREVERDMKYEEYAGREGDIVTGIVQQTDNRYTLLDLGKVEALLPQAEQVSYERYEHGARLKAYIVEVRKTTKGPQIVVSRTHPGLIKRLFELEVPEIGSGVVEIKAAAREPGHRTKIAVWSNDPNVDPVGACVGARGSRVRMVTNELRGERVDVVPFSDDPVELIQNALAPARVREVRLDEETGTATVIVSDFQLSLAIGKEGQNARAGGAADRLAHRHQERDPAGRGRGRRLRRAGLGRGRVGRGRERRAGVEAGRGRRGHVGRGMDPPGRGSDGGTRLRVRRDRRGRSGGAGRARNRECRNGACRRACLRSRRRGGRRDHRGVRRGRGIAPTRTCVGCRSALPADQLIRIVRLPGGALSVDRHAAGRGAWLCRDSPGCLDEAVRRHGFERAFSASIDAESLQQLCAHLGEAWERPAPDVRG